MIVFSEVYGHLSTTAFYRSMLLPSPLAHPFRLFSNPCNPPIRARTLVCAEFLSEWERLAQTQHKHWSESRASVREWSHSPDEHQTLFPVFCSFPATDPFLGSSGWEKLEQTGRWSQVILVFFASEVAHSLRENSVRVYRQRKPYIGHAWRTELSLVRHFSCLCSLFTVKEILA